MSLRFPADGQFTALVRHFFARFFDNEFVAQNSEMHVTVTKILALLAAPGIVLPCERMMTYLRLDGLPQQAWWPTLWFDRSFFICFSMLVMGGVTILEWDALFPDRRDYVSLIPLPIRSRTIFLAKVASLFIFLLAFTVAVNIVSVVLFPLVSFRGDTLHLVWAIVSQGVTIFCANGFVFLFLIALEGVLLNVLSVAWFRRASVYVQCAAVCGLLSLFFLFPDIADHIFELRTQHPATLFAFPPMWFLGLNEWLLGTPDAAMLQLASWARWGLLSVTLIAAAAYSIAYRRHVRRTLESVEGAEGVRTRFDNWIGRIADRLVGNPVERASVAFIGKTVARSAKHRIFLAVYVGAGFALVAQSIAGSHAASGVQNLKQVWLSAPLVLSFFSLSGLRYIFTVPVELPANWLFRVTENNHRGRALDGSRRAMLWFAVAPLFAALSPFYFLMWTPWIAAAHLLFSVTISLLLIEAMLVEFWKIPFTCSYPPGKANVTVLWIVYWGAFTLYAYSMAALETWMVKRPPRLIVFYLAAAIVWQGFEIYRRRWNSVGFSLVFDDAPEPIVRTLGLSEIAWLSAREQAREASRASTSGTPDAA